MQTSNDEKDRDIIRARAVTQHEERAEVFEQLYRGTGAEDPYASAFRYGRTKIDGLLRPWLEDLGPGASVLDAGCGTGEQVHAMRAMGFDVTGLDPAPRMRELALEKNPGCTIVDGSITDLPFGDGEFDGVLAIEVLRYLHADDVMQAYREMLRVLKPGGTLFVTLVNTWAADGFFLLDTVRRSFHRMTGRQQRVHCEFMTPARAHRDLSQAGATDIRTYGRLFGPIRASYKLGRPVGRAVARALSSFDDRISAQEWSVPFAGHLIATARRPG